MWHRGDEALVRVPLKDGRGIAQVLVLSGFYNNVLAQLHGAECQGALMDGKVDIAHATHSQQVQQPVLADGFKLGDKVASECMA